MHTFLDAPGVVFHLFVNPAITHPLLARLKKIVRSSTAVFHGSEAGLCYTAGEASIHG